MQRLPFCVGPDRHVVQRLDQDSGLFSDFGPLFFRPDLMGDPESTPIEYLAGKHLPRSGVNAEVLPVR